MVLYLWSASDNEEDWLADLSHKTGPVLYQPLDPSHLLILFQSISVAPYLRYSLPRTRL